MPKIINAYSDASGSIGDSLKSLGESMFGNGAQNEVHRQTAVGKRRENDNVPLMAEAVRSGDRNALAYYGVMANKSGADAANYNLLSTTNHAGSVDDNRVNLAQIGAGHSIGTTAVGQGREHAVRQAIQKIASDRAAATQLAIAEREQQSRDDQYNRTPEKVEEGGAIVLRPRSQAMGMRSGDNVNLANARTLNDQTTQRTMDAARYNHDNTPTTVYNPDGTSRIVSQAQAVTGGYNGPPKSLDQVKAGIVQQAVQPPAQDAAIPPGQTAPEQSAPAGYIHPLVQETLGYGKGAVPYQHAQSGAVGQSYDGGRTIDGHPAGPGWVPVTSQEAIGQTRTNSQMDAARQPLPAAPTAYPQAAQDAAATSGLKSLAQSEFNKTIGFVGGPEIGANTNRARENLTGLANEARSVLLSSPGRAAVQAQKWANASIPQPGFMGMTGANADQQRNAVVTLTQQMRQVYAAEAAEAADPNTNPQDRAKLVSHMSQLKRIIGMYEQPTAKPQAPQPGAPAPGPQQAAPRPRATNPQTGQTIEFDGQSWVPVQ